MSGDTGKRQIMKAYRVPEWVALDAPRPSWWRHPVKRFRAWWWGRA